MVRPCCWTIQETGLNHKHRHGEDGCSEVLSSKSKFFFHFKMLILLIFSSGFPKWLIHASLKRLNVHLLLSVEPKVSPQLVMPPLLLNAQSNAHIPPSPRPTRNKLHNQLMELQNPAWRGLTNSSRLQAPAILTSVAPDCGEAGRTWGACLLASAGRKASRLQHHTRTAHTHAHSKTHSFSFSRSCD